MAGGGKWNELKNRCGVFRLFLFHVCSQQQSSGDVSGPVRGIRELACLYYALLPPPSLSLSVGLIDLTTSINRRREQQLAWTLHQGQAAFNTMLMEQTGIKPTRKTLHWGNAPEMDPQKINSQRHKVRFVVAVIWGCRKSVRVLNSLCSLEKTKQKTKQRIWIWDGETQDRYASPSWEYSF